MTKRGGGTGGGGGGGGRGVAKISTNNSTLPSDPLCLAFIQEHGLAGAMVLITSNPFLLFEGQKSEQPLCVVAVHVDGMCSC